MKTVFMGTPDFAAVCLEALVSEKYDIVGVFCQPDKPVGRKAVLTPPPVKVTAQKYGLSVYQPEKLRDGTAMAILRELSPDIIVVVAYGKILPAEMLDLPQYGCINLHGSLLPALRGAAPIQWAVIKGLKTTGVTVMKMDAGQDTGDIIASASTEIGENETAGELFDRLSGIGAKFLVETLPRYISGELKPTAQDHSLATEAPMLSKEISNIDWSKSAYEIHDLIRGLNPWPTAVTNLRDTRLKIHASKVLGKGNGKTAGCVLESSGKLIVQCGDDTALEITELQRDGSKRMPAADMLRGYKIEKDDVLG